MRAGISKDFQWKIVKIQENDEFYLKVTEFHDYRPFSNQSATVFNANILKWATHFISLMGF